MPKPKPECMVCGHALACLFVDLQTFTFQQLLDRVLKKEMAFSRPTVMCENFLYEEGDDLEEDEVEEYAKLLPKTIAQLPGSIVHNTRLEVTDQAQNLKVTLVLQQQVRIGLYMQAGSFQPCKRTYRQCGPYRIVDACATISVFMQISDHEEKAVTIDEGAGV